MTYFQGARIPLHLRWPQLCLLWEIKSPWQVGGPFPSQFSTTYWYSHVLKTLHKQAKTTQTGAKGAEVASFSLEIYICELKPFHHQVNAVVRNFTGASQWCEERCMALVGLLLFIFFDINWHALIGAQSFIFFGTPWLVLEVHTFHLLWYSLTFPGWCSHLLSLSWRFCATGEPGDRGGVDRGEEEDGKLESAFHLDQRSHLW